MITGFHHSGFVVKDLDKMLAFYHDLLGLQVLSKRETPSPTSNDPREDPAGVGGAQRRIAFLGQDSSQHQLELTQFLQPPGHGAGEAHVCLQVENIEETYQQLSAKGIDFVTPPLARQWPNGTLKICRTRDPEGNWVELLEFIPS